VAGILHRHLLDELVTERTSGPKALLLQRHVLFGLRVEGRVLDQAIDKQTQVVLHLDGEGAEHSQLCATRTRDEESLDRLPLVYSA